MVWEKEKFREEKVRSLIRTFLEFVNEVVSEGGDVLQWQPLTH